MCAFRVAGMEIMRSMILYPRAAVERAMKLQEVILRGVAKKNHVVASCRDPGDQRPAHAANLREDVHALESRQFPEIAQKPLRVRLARKFTLRLD
jgi:hypothetical protein